MLEVVGPRRVGPRRVGLGEHEEVRQGQSGEGHRHGQCEVAPVEAVPDHEAGHDRQQHDALPRMQPRRRQPRDAGPHGVPPRRPPGASLRGVEHPLDAQQEQRHARHRDRTGEAAPRVGGGVGLERHHQRPEAQVLARAEPLGQGRRGREVEEGERQRGQPGPPRALEDAVHVRGEPGQHRHHRDRLPHQEGQLDAGPQRPQQPGQGEHRVQEQVRVRDHVVAVGLEDVLPGVADEGQVLHLVVDLQPLRAVEHPLAPGGEQHHVRDHGEQREQAEESRFGAVLAHVAPHVVPRAALDRPSASILLPWATRATTQPSQSTASAGT